MVAGETPAVAADPRGGRRVRVWFGRYVIAAYSVDSDLAEAYVEVRREHLVGLELTVGGELTGAERPLPPERRWDAVAP